MKTIQEQYEEKEQIHLEAREALRLFDMSENERIDKIEVLQDESRKLSRVIDELRIAEGERPSRREYLKGIIRSRESQLKIFCNQHPGEIQF